MKIALVILHADPARGGAERYTVDLAAALAKRGHAVSLLAASFAEEIEGVRNVELKSGGLTRGQRYRRFLDAVDREIETIRYDVVHAMLPVRRCDVYHPHAGMADEQMGKWNRIFNPRRVAMADVERELLLGNDPPVTIALSQYVKRAILQSYTLPSDRLATLFNAVDLNRFQPDSPRTQPGIRGLIVAQDFERKGVVTLLEANQLLYEKHGDLGLRFTVVGGSSPDHWRHVAESYRGGESIEFVGSKSDTRPFYAAADFFVLPTKHDPCSLVVLEALAMGLPVISTVYNGATEIMTDGVHGYILSDPTDVDALADALRKILDDDRRAEMRQACLALRPQLSYEHHLDGLLAIYIRATTRS